MFVYFGNDGRISTTYPVALAKYFVKTNKVKFLRQTLVDSFQSEEGNLYFIFKCSLTYIARDTLLKIWSPYKLKIFFLFIFFICKIFVAFL